MLSFISVTCHRKEVECTQERDQQGFLFCVDRLPSVVSYRSRNDLLPRGSKASHENLFASDKVQDNTYFNWHHQEKKHIIQLFFFRAMMEAQRVE
jgi:hypothetical protein